MHDGGTHGAEACPETAPGIQGKEKALRLSEAIREGSDITVATRNDTLLKFDGVTYGCALGAAAHAVCGMTTGYFHDVVRALGKKFPYLRTIQAKCPACEEDESDPTGLHYIIANLNDAHGWTPSQIADWVQCQEALHGIGQPESVDSPAVTQERVSELIEA